jgi:branched-chain amino acid transport system permease protein
LNEIFISIGLIYLIQNAAAVIWTDEYRIIHSPFESITISFFGVNLPLDYLIIIITTILILVGLYLFLRKTRLGKAMRATSQNRKGAMLMGINVEKMDMISFGIGAGLAGAAGTLWVVSGQVFTPYMGSIPAVKAFAIIIIGGLGSIPGAIVGGIILGLAENFAIFTIGGAWKDAISFLILIVVLIFKPTGLFGESAE